MEIPALPLAYVGLGDWCEVHELRRVSRYAGERGIEFEMRWVSGLGPKVVGLRRGALWHLSGQGGG